MYPSAIGIYDASSLIFWIVTGTSSSTSGGTKYTARESATIRPVRPNDYCIEPIDLPNLNHLVLVATRISSGYGVLTMFRATKPVYAKLVSWFNPTDSPLFGHV